MWLRKINRGAPVSVCDFDRFCFLLPDEFTQSSEIE
jgi:hypothetical protein